MAAISALTTKNAKNAKLSFITLLTINAGNARINSGTAKDVLFNKAAQNVRTLHMSTKEAVSPAETLVLAAKNVQTKISVLSVSLMHIT